MENYKIIIETYSHASIKMRESYQDLFSIINDSLLSMKGISNQIKALTLNYTGSDNENGDLLQKEIEDYQLKLIDIEKEIEQTKEKFNDIKQDTKKIQEYSFEFEKSISRKLFYILQKDKLEFERIIEKFNSYFLKVQEHFVIRIKNTLPLAKENDYYQKELSSIFDNIFLNIIEGLEILQMGNEYAKLTIDNLEKIINEIEKKIFMVDTDEQDKIKLNKMIQFIRNISEVELKKTNDKKYYDLQKNYEKDFTEDSKRLSKDGQILFKSNRNGIFIKILPPYAGGKFITINEITRFLNDKKVVLPSYELLKSILIKIDKEYTKIMDYIPNEKYDGRGEIDISYDKLTVFLTLYPPKYFGKNIDLQDIKEMLDEKNIIFGVDVNKIVDIINNNIYYTPQIIANGVTPTPGEPEKYEYFFKNKFTFKDFSEDDSSRIDFKNISYIQNIAKGTIIARKIEAIEGKPGKNVHAEEIILNTISDYKLILGKNVIFSDNQKDIISTTNGYAKLIDNVLSIETLYVVEHDVDYSIGNIIFLGSVLVKGNVLDGFSIKATGDIEIFGVVGKSFLTSENNIILHNGIKGNEEGTIQAGNNVIAKFIEYANVYAGNNVIVSKDIFNSNIKADNQILCLHNNSKIIGGKVYASRSIISQVFGNERFVQTFVELGIPSKINDKYQMLLKENESVKKEEKKLLKDLDHFTQNEKSNNTLSLENLEKKKRINQSISLNKLYKNEIEEDIRAVEKEIESYNIMGEIIVLEKMFPETNIKIQKASFQNKETIHKIKFYLKNNTITSEILTKKHIGDILYPLLKT